MNALNLAENIIRLRHDKKITQEQLADFVGVTKASVSKWGTKQSMPDILLLPQLAAFFDVTIDELLGYEPQLSKERMQKIYLELASDFAKNPFEEVIERVQALEKEYYSCYPFLYQVILLYLNHFMLHNGKIALQGTLEEVKGVRGGNGLEIEFCKPQDVQQFQSLYAVGKQESALKLLYEKKTEQDMMKIMGILVEHQIVVQRMELLEPNLEDLFMEVVGR